MHAGSSIRIPGRLWNVPVTIQPSSNAHGTVDEANYTNIAASLKEFLPDFSWSNKRKVHTGKEVSHYQRRTRSAPNTGMHIPNNGLNMEDKDDTVSNPSASFKKPKSRVLFQCTFPKLSGNNGENEAGCTENKTFKNKLPHGSNCEFALTEHGKKIRMMWDDNDESLPEMNVGVGKCPITMVDVDVENEPGNETNVANGMKRVRKSMKRVRSDAVGKKGKNSQVELKKRNNSKLHAIDKGSCDDVDDDDEDQGSMKPPEDSRHSHDSVRKRGRMAGMPKMRKGGKKVPPILSDLQQPLFGMGVFQHAEKLSAIRRKRMVVKQQSCKMGLDGPAKQLESHGHEPMKCHAKQNHSPQPKGNAAGMYALDDRCIYNFKEVQASSCFPRQSAQDACQVCTLP